MTRETSADIMGPMYGDVRRCLSLSDRGEHLILSPRER